MDHEQDHGGNRRWRSSSALIGSPVAHATPSPDPSDYYAWLRRDGFLVDGNESYLLGLAMMVCNMKDAGYADSDIGDYIARRESIPNIKGYEIFLDADIQYCSLTHPLLLPPTYQLPPAPPPTHVQLPPGYNDGD